MDFEFLVTVVLERESGPFPPREETKEQVEEALTDADYGSWSIDTASGNVSELYTEDWSVEEHETPKLPTAKRLRVAIPLLREAGGREGGAVAEWLEKSVLPGAEQVEQARAQRRERKAAEEARS